MSYGDAIGRIGTIQTTLARISGAAPATAQSPATAAAPASGASGASGSLYAGAAQPVAPGGLTAGQLAGTGWAAPARTASAPASAALFTEALAAEVARAAPAAPAAPVSAAPVSAARPAGPVEADAGTTGADVVATARKYLGIPYVWGGNNPATGLDCSSLVQHTFRDLGVELPRVARDQARMGAEVDSLAQARPGDLIVTRGGGHIGIYLGDNRMLHAPRPGENVSIRELFETDADIMTIRRIVPAASSAAASAAPAGSAP
ncbi:C40 family peptidase [Arthrobacter halodurans]|uniref:C40 family peptidase n=1 Tax=Arthrobacter halodurans TaxID=516699 RepID=A0ABV4UNY0_9MICC